MRIIFPRLILSFFVCLLALPAFADTYKIDTKGAHASIRFTVTHLGFSWLTGRFNHFEGSFNYDEENPGNSSVEVVVDVASLDSNHAERDKHLRSDEYLDVKKYPEAKFTSTSFTDHGDGKATMKGNFSFHGVTREITIDVKKVGSGISPWNPKARHVGFSGTTQLKLADFGVKTVGPAKTVYLSLNVEGINVQE